MCAINLLNSTLAAGTARRVESRGPVPVPPPSQLALLNTLLVHPRHTTRVDKPDHLDVASLALDYLRSLLEVAGPVNADMRTAFRFTCVPRASRRARLGVGDGGDDDNGGATDPESDGDGDRLRGSAANESSLWTRGQNFWSTVGWAFNCSVLHPQRWRYWRPWLDFMLDVLEADWDERQRTDLESYEASGGEGEQPVTSRQDSLIFAYMNQASGRQGGLKGIIKALVADGGPLSSSFFPEVFDKELRGSRRVPKKRKRDMVLDLDNDKFGDYFDDGSFSSDLSPPPTPQKPCDAGRGGRPDRTFGASGAGLAESCILRLRLFRLLSAATVALRRPAELARLYEHFTSSVKLLPLPTFSIFISQRANRMLPETHITIIKELFHLLLPSSYQSPRKVDPVADARGDLTAPMLEHCYVAYPANTVGFEDNAKLSLVVESSIRLLWACGMLDYTDGLARAVEVGIAAREAKAKKCRPGKGRTTDDDRFAQELLHSSATRIRIWLDVLKTARPDE